MKEESIMDIEGKIIKLDSIFREYINLVLTQQRELIAENNFLKKEIYKMQSQINTINQTLHGIELAFLGNKAVYDELTEEFNELNNSLTKEDDEFLHLSNKAQLKKIREIN